MADQGRLELVGAGILVAGVDEAGRGPLAGPVVTAAVILDPARPVDGLTDSKLLSDSLRESLAAAIRERAIAWAVARAEVAEIDRLNILHATLAAMVRAVRALEPAPGFVRVDGNQLPRGLPCPGEPVVKGDLSEAAISAASILAKTERDQVMRGLAERHPRYGFENHKGYATPEHLKALERHGPCCEHRRSFAPVQRLLCVGDPPRAGGASSPER